MKNTPKLRFKGFEGEWEEKVFTDVASRLSQTEKAGDLPGVEFEDIVSGHGILNKDLDEKQCNKVGKLFSAGDVLFGKLRPYLKNILLPDFSGVAIGDFWVLHPEGIESKLLYEIVNSDRFMEVANVSSGSKMPRADWNFVSNAIVAVPSDKSEQRKLSSYFTHLDTLIEASRQKVEKLKQVKAASLQSFFPAHGQRTPNVRFKGCEGEWKVVKLNSFAKRVVRKNTHLESTLALTIASAHGLISQKDYFNNSVVGANIRNYYLLKKGEFAYNKSYSNGFPFGSVKRLDNYEQGILSTLYIVFSIDDSIDSDYLCHFFDTSLWHNDVAERATEGARNHGLLNIGAEDFLDIDIILPNSLPEQRKIASYFTHLDTLLTLERQRYEKLQQVKRASLSQMLV